MFFSGIDQRSTVLIIFIALSVFGTIFFLLLRKTSDKEQVVRIQEQFHKMNIVRGHEDQLFRSKHNVGLCFTPSQEYNKQIRINTYLPNV